MRHCADADVTCFPNPFSRALHIRISDTDLMSLKLYDISGRLVMDFTRQARTGFIAWNAEGRAPGIYVLKAAGTSKIFHKRMVLTK